MASRLISIPAPCPCACHAHATCWMAPHDPPRPAHTSQASSTYMPPGPTPPAHTAPCSFPTSTPTTATCPFAPLVLPAPTLALFEQFWSRWSETAEGKQNVSDLAWLRRSAVQHCFAQLVHKRYGQPSPKHTQGDVEHGPRPDIVLYNTFLWHYRPSAT